MKYINRARGSGKTTSLIYSSYTTGYPIITIDEARARAVKTQANSLGLEIKVFSLKEWTRYQVHKDSRYWETNYILIDEATEIIEIALQQMLGAPVIACTFTIPCQDIEKKEAADNE